MGMPLYAKRWILVMAGVLSGHQLAHAFAHSHINDEAHGYLGIASAIVYPAALLVIVRLARTEARTGRRAIHLTDLLTTQGVVFGAQEMTEAISVGVQPLEMLIDPILWLGVAAQMITVGVSLSFISAARVLLTQWTYDLTPHELPHPTPQTRQPTATTPRSALLTSLPASRAPPVFV
jgi:hypothetical protein